MTVNYYDPNYAGGSAQIINHRLVLNCGRTRGGYGRIVSNAPHSVIGSHAHVRVTFPSMHGLEFHFRLRDKTDAENYEFLIEDSKLQFLREGVPIGPPLDYDPSAHRWLRLREADGIMHFEVAPDSDSAPGAFTALETDAIVNNEGFDAKSCFVELFVRHIGTDNVTAELQAFNTNVASG